MAGKKNTVTGFVDFDLTQLEPDPAVAALLGQGTRREDERRLPAKERRKKARQREKDQKRSKALYDLPEELISEVARLATSHKTTASGICHLALARLLDEVATGSVQIRDYLQPIDSPRYENRVMTQKRTD